MPEQHLSLSKLVWESKGENNRPEITAYFTARPDEPFGYREFEQATLPRAFLIDLERFITEKVIEFTREWK